MSSKIYWPLWKSGSPTGLIIQYIKPISNSSTTKQFVAPQFVELLYLINHNRNNATYTSNTIHRLLLQTQVIQAPTKLISSAQPPVQHNFYAQSYEKNKKLAPASYIKPEITVFRVCTSNICEFFGISGHHTYSCIDHGNNLLTKSMQRKTTV